jgi:hypothetical protein
MVSELEKNPQSSLIVLGTVKRAHDRIFAQGTFRSKPTATFTVGKVWARSAFKLSERHVTNPLPGDLKAFLQGSQRAFVKKAAF